MTNPTRTAMIGCGLMARHHLTRMLDQQETTEIVALVEPSQAAYDACAALFAARGLAAPPQVNSLEQALAGNYALDAAFIITPHALHHDQTVACMEAGLDVLLEKPMVTTAVEARSLIATRDRTGKLLVVAFPGSLSPQIRTATGLLRAGEFGRVQSISGTVWQDWGPVTAGSWRQQPELSGGGFLFDTGGHVLNTITDLASEEFSEIAAWFDHRGRPVETMATVMGRLASGAFVTIHACGEAMPGCTSEIRVFCDRAVIYTGMWGESLSIQTDAREPLTPFALPPSLGVWETFQQVRAGELANPCPPEVGLRMARLWDAVRASAAQNGVPVRVTG